MTRLICIFMALVLPLAVAQGAMQSPVSKEVCPDTTAVTRREMQAMLHDDMIRRQLTHEEYKLDSARMADTERALRHERLYDSIASKSQRRTLSRLFYNMLFTTPTVDDGKVVDESLPLRPFEGRTIGEITILRNNIFDMYETDTRFRRAANNMHVKTRERVIGFDLLFRPGDRLDPEVIVRNKQLLRSRPYIADVEIEVVPRPDDSSVVDIVIRTRDSWTITADAALRSDKRTMVALSDANILGTGTLLRLETNFNRSTFGYGGNMVEYEVPNLVGTFVEARLRAGRNFKFTTLDIDLRKEFVQPTDYKMGATYSVMKQDRYMVEQDTSLLMKERNLDLWGGYSRYHPDIAASIYLTGHYNSRRFDIRPEVGRDLHPALHQSDMLLAAVGLYREKFLTANMIYGFGQREYMAEGLRTEISGGYVWGEFGDALYLGTAYKQGAFTKWGYFMGSVSLGGYRESVSGEWGRFAADVNAGWFSNLIRTRRCHVRQFANLHYTQGWHRAAGSDESLRFTDDNGLKSLTEHHIGTSRMALNTETVVFTPLEPWGFRIALFGFADFGLLGYERNPFANSFFTTLGIGARLRNERLIFSTIQIRLGIAFGKGGMMDCEYFRLSNGTRMEQQRYMPTRPETVAFE